AAGEERAEPRRRPGGEAVWPAGGEAGLSPGAPAALQLSVAPRASTGGAGHGLVATSRGPASLRSGPERRTKGWYPSRGREPTSRAACRSHERLHPRLLEGRAGAGLSLMQRLVNEAELGVVDLSGARAILDVGAGLGQMTRALARAATPGARVVGVGP